MDVISEIRDERLRQIDLGFDAQNDDQYEKNELVRAAVAYCLDRVELQVNAPPPALWPFDAGFWKPKTRRENLIRCAALIVAEIERTDREDNQIQRDC